MGSYQAQWLNNQLPSTQLPFTSGKMGRFALWYLNRSQKSTSHLWFTWKSCAGTSFLWVQQPITRTQEKWSLVSVCIQWGFATFAIQCCKYVSSHNAAAMCFYHMLVWLHYHQFLPRPTFYGVVGRHNINELQRISTCTLLLQPSCPFSDSILSCIFNSLSKRVHIPVLQQKTKRRFGDEICQKKLFYLAINWQDHTR